MTITQEMLIRSIAQKEGQDINTIRQIIRSIEHTMFDCLSLTTYDEPTIIRILNGFQIEGTYVPESVISKGMFQNVPCPARIHIKPVISKYYTQKLNKYQKKRG